MNVRSFVNAFSELYLLVPMVWSLITLLIQLLLVYNSTIYQKMRKTIKNGKKQRKLVKSWESQRKPGKMKEKMGNPEKNQTKSRESWRNSGKTSE